ncbi:MAG: recombinase family protein [Oscillospiraceae bacterium]|nr:recombinase family protein [Oscillospiraceae bacterium]
MKKTAIYCRLSEEDRNKKNRTDESESIQNQKSMLLQYAMEKGFEVYGIYSDDDFAGADRNRPEWNKLLSDAEQKKFDVILCKSQSRFTREMEMVEKYIHYLLPLWGIRFIGLIDYADSDDKGNKKSRQINGLVNEWYIEDMSDNIKKTLTNRREQGYHIGSFALYGYLKDPQNKGRLIVDEEAAAVVREVFALFVSGYGRTAIAKALNAKGVPNPTEYKRIKGITYKPSKSKIGTLWRDYTISDMLKNEMYVGTMVQGRYGSVSYKSKINKPKPKGNWIRVQNTHEPIISTAMWEQSQELIRQRAKPFSTGEIGLFAKKAKCMYCNYTLRSSKNRDRYYLKCATKHTAKDACEGSFIPVTQLEQAVLSELKSLFEKYFDKAKVEERLMPTQDFADRIAKLKSSKEAYEKEIAGFSKSRQELYKDKVKGLIDESEFIELSRDFTKDKEKLEALVNGIERDINNLELKAVRAKDRKQIIAEYSRVERLDRVMVERLIDFISVGKRDPETKQVPIDIYWNF